MRAFTAALTRRILPNNVDMDINDEFWIIELNPENQNRIFPNDVDMDINDEFWNVELNPENQNRPWLPNIVEHQERHRNFNHFNNNNMLQVAPAA